jgi:DNA gyrase inhibitor GyrI
MNPRKILTARRCHVNKLRVFLILIAAVAVLVMPLFAQETAEKKVPEAAAKAPEEGAFKLIKIEPFDYCAVEMTGTYEQHAGAFMSLYSGAAQQGLPMDQMPFGVYWNSPENTPEEDLKWEIGFAVPEGTEVKAPLVKKRWEHTDLIWTRYEGAYDSPEMNSLYDEIFEWAGKHGYEPAGPFMEKFLDSPEPDESGEYSGTVEIMVPVVKKK